MNKYRLVLCTRTSFNFKQKAIEYRFVLDSIKVKIRKINCEVDRKLSGIKYGFIIEIELLAKDIKSATSQAFDISELFLSIMSIETGVESHKSTLILAYDITEGISERNFIQYFYDLPISRPQQVDLEIYKNHLEAIISFDNNQKDRLYRSIRWLRKGINEDDPLDQFLALWQGLETLNPVLADYFNCDNAGKETVEQRCIKSGDLFYIERTTKQGLEKLVNEVKLGKQIWKNINKTRNAISHGYGKFAELYNETIRLSPHLAKLLHEGISLILGFEFDKNVIKHLDNVAPIKVGDSYIIECKLEEKDISKLASNYYYPYFLTELKDVQEEFEVVEEKNGFRVKQDIIPVIGCKYTDFSFSVSGRSINIELISVK
ncbi:hypothetical protein GAG94_15320 [Lysinibacillus sphaericus]|nr:hypothetical protein GAG94_15320 [Lysinibacillus sphaericus]